MEFTRRAEVSLGFEAAIAAAKDALKEQGFGVLTEIDIQQTLKEKIGAEVEPQVILGACNPELANEALAIDARIAALLPCNVVVRREGETTVVEALDPAIMASVPENPALEAVAHQAAERIQAALAALPS